MHQLNKSDKKLVFWGTGNVCSQIMLYYPEITPIFCIDSFSNNKQINGIEVKHPDEIDDWRSYYIVITTMESSAIERILESKNMIKHIDYCDFKTFLQISPTWPSNSISEINKYNNTIVKKEKILIVAPIFLARNTSVLIHFFKEYVKANSNYEIIVISTLGALTNSKAENILGCHTFDLPKVCLWNGIGNEEQYSSFSSQIELSQEDEKFIDGLEEDKMSTNKEISYKNTKEIYCYFKEVIRILNPEKILIWGMWARGSYILKHIAEDRNIKYGFMEHGWIPGTIQFDPLGIAGHSVYSVFPEKLQAVQVTNVDIGVVHRVKSNILDNCLDTGKFYDTEHDRAALARIRTERKNIFLVGMDEKGMGMNPNSEYWKKHVSPVYESMKQVLDELQQICTKYQWNLLYKPHPGNQLENADKYVKEGLILVKDKSIDALLQIADVVVSMSSAVEYKALMYEKPLVQVGVTGLNKQKCTYEVKNRFDLEGVMLNAVEQGMTELQKENYNIFLAKLLKAYLWDDLSKREIRYGLTFDTDFLHERGRV